MSKSRPTPGDVAAGDAAGTSLQFPEWTNTDTYQCKPLLEPGDPKAVTIKGAAPDPRLPTVAWGDHGWNKNAVANWLIYGRPLASRLSTPAVRWVCQTYRPNSCYPGLIEAEGTKLGTPEDFLAEVVAASVFIEYSANLTIRRRMSNQRLSDDLRAIASEIVTEITQIIEGTQTQSYVEEEYETPSYTVMPSPDELPRPVATHYVYHNRLR